MTLAVVIQARMTSTRLPGKVLLPLAGAPLLQRMIERVQAATVPMELVVATTEDPSDDPIVELCRALDVRCFRGHPTDLLDRHLRAAMDLKADSVAKIPSDCPLIDPCVIDRVIGFWARYRAHFDYVSNLHPATYPDGNDVEVMSMEALATAWREAHRDYEREHTTPFLWEQPERFRIANIAWETGIDHSMRHRWTIDYPEDYEFIKAVYDQLWPSHGKTFNMYDILDLLERRPDIASINARFVGVNWYRHYVGTLRTIQPHEMRPAPTL